MFKKLKTKLNIFPVIAIFLAFLFSFPKNSLAANKIEKEDLSETNENESIGKPGPIYQKTRIINGKPACAKGGDSPSVSTKNRSGHIDGECCLDYDETPNSNCYYPPGKYGDLLEDYQDRHGD